MDTSTRYLGCCQICEAEFKLHDSKLVHHGFRRPGHGSIVGDCLGVQEDPYEVSCELIKRVLASVEFRRASTSAYKDKLESGEVTHFTRLDCNWSRSRETVAYSYAIGVTEHGWWLASLHGRISELENEISQMDRDIHRFQQRITNWKPMPIRETSEEKMNAEKRAAQAARTEENRKRREEKQAKANAIKAKRDALEAKRQAIRDDFSKQFQALASVADQPQAQQLARGFAQQLRKTKYSFLHPRDLKCDDELVKLGLATRDNRDPKWVHYNF